MKFEWRRRDCHSLTSVHKTSFRLPKGTSLTLAFRPAPLNEGRFGLSAQERVGVDLTPSQSVGPVIILSQKQIVQMLFPVIFY